jgi:hypothetical protein
MSTNRRLFLLITCTLFITGCSTASTRRYRSAEPLCSNSPNRSVDVAAFSFSAPPSSSQAPILTLSERGQAALIGAVGGDPEKASKLLLALGLNSPKATPSVDDRTTFRRRLVLSLDNNSACPADRISWARLHLSLQNTYGRFLSWDKLISEHDTVDLAKITTAQTTAFSVGTELAGGAAAPTVAVPAQKGLLGFNTGRTQTSEVNLRQRYVRSSGSLEDKKATLLQQSVVGIDLTGNLIVDVEVKYEKTNFSYVTTISRLFEEGKASIPEKVLIETRPTLYPEDAKVDLVAQLSLDYVLREVQAGDRTILEGDDKILLQKQHKDGKEFVLVPRESLRMTVYELVSPAGDFLHMGSANDLEIVSLGTYDNARDLLLWLKQMGPQSISGRSFFVGRQPLSKDLIGKLRITPHPLNWEIPEAR